MATTKDRAELVEMAADELGLTSSGNAVAAEDSDKIDGRVDGLILELEARGIVGISNVEAIPIEYTGPVALLLANECAVTFGKPRMTTQERESIEERLRVMVQREPAAAETLSTDPMLRGSGRYTYNRWLRGT